MSDYPFCYATTADVERKRSYIACSGTRIAGGQVVMLHRNAEDCGSHRPDQWAGEVVRIVASCPVLVHPLNEMLDGICPEVLAFRNTGGY